MFSLTKPSVERIRRFLNDQQQQPFSYPEVGSTNSILPAGYNIDHNRIHLGYGEQVFNCAIAAVRNWKMHDLEWLELCWPNAPIEAGSIVAIVCRHFGFWSCHPAKIVYVIDEADDHACRFGFGYGTLPAHDEQGEERFLIEWLREDDSVWYDILAFSRPASILAKLGYSLVRMLQKRFARDSKQAMLNYALVAGHSTE
ncbi:MAG: DUF1990 domain-containing protein [Acidobacteria bacterium]|nr:DUF1990 domain-containing protein [Acidobacteriota bacterium]